VRELPEVLLLVCKREIDHLVVLLVEAAREVCAAVVQAFD
jgi:hypothetical protein